MAEHKDDIILDLDDYEIIARVDLAICLRHIDGDETWLPISQIILDEENGLIWIPLWLAQKEGLA